MDKPKYCSIFLTNACVLKCKICEIWRAAGDDQELDLEGWKPALTRLRDVLDPEAEICFTGGEPLIKKGIVELIRFAGEIGFRTGLNTNGYLLDAAMAEALRDASLWSITFSLDGLNEQTHDFIRGVPGSYKRVIQAIDHLSASRIQIGIGTVIVEQNLDEITDLVFWTEKQPRLQSIRFQAMMQPLATPQENSWHRNERYNPLWPKDIMKVNRVLDTLVGLKEEKKVGKLSNPAAQLKIFRDYFRDPSAMMKARGCVFSDAVININQTGELRLCPKMRSLGNVRTGSPQELLNSDHAGQVREAMKNCKTDCDSVVNCFWE
jgi:MoaA/NifB/PqqE/SkfB family radical SAM enzyme